MNPARPITVAIGWSVATIGMAAWVTDGPILRPGVVVGPIEFGIALSLAAAIAWPFVTRGRVLTIFVAAQGLLMLTLVAAAREASPCATIGSAVGWVAWNTLAAAGRAWSFRRGVSVETIWTAVLSVTVLGILAFAGP